MSVSRFIIIEVQFPSGPLSYGVVAGVPSRLFVYTERQFKPLPFERGPRIVRDVDQFKTWLRRWLRRDVPMIGHVTIRESAAVVSVGT